MLATFTSPARMSLMECMIKETSLMSLTELSLGADNLVSDIPAGNGNVANLFFTVPSTCEPIQETRFFPQKFSCLNLISPNRIP
jgi:hypothetical protein